MSKSPKIFFLVRYSFLSAEAGAWALARDSQDRASYEGRLFSDKRLRYRERLFARYTLPSLAGQVGVNSSDFRLLLLVSDRLPDEARRRLNDLCAHHSFITICEASPEDDVVTKALTPWLSQLADDEPYMTIRLDDDDAVAKKFVAEMKNYLNFALEGFVISHGRGYVADIRGSEPPIFRRLYQLKMSVGMGYVSVKRDSAAPASVFIAGNHRRVDEKVPTVIFSRDPMFLYTKHSSADTFNEAHFERMSKLAIVDRETVESVFALGDDAFEPM